MVVGATTATSMGVHREAMLRETMMARFLGSVGAARRETRMAPLEVATARDVVVGAMTVSSQASDASMVTKPKKAVPLVAQIE